MLEIRKSCINAARVVKKMQPKEKPDLNDLYRYFGGMRHLLTKRQKDKMIEIAKKDLEDFVEYVNNSSVGGGME